MSPEAVYIPGKYDFRLKNSQNSGELLVLRDRSPGYSPDNMSPEEKFYYECFKPLEDRIGAAVDEDRFFHDELGVAIMAMKLGLCMIEGSEKDAVALRNETWVESGKTEKLKEELLDSLENDISEYGMENLEELSGEELLEVYRKINSRKI